MNEINNAWTPEAVNNVVENTTKCVTAGVVIAVIVKNVANYISLTGRDVTFVLVQRKLYKL